ncbi:MAG: thioredoxin [Candidatus Aenigmatarchaeota archaeon]
MVEEISGEELLDLVKKNKMVVVDIYADWCYPCKILSPIIEEVSKEYKNIKFVKINVDENTEIAQLYDVKSIPTLLYFQNGNLVNRTVGALPKTKIKEIIEKTFSL